MMELKGTLLGKNIYCYEPGFQCSENDVANFLAQFHRLNALRTLLDFTPLLPENHGTYEEGGVPITEDLLMDAALYIIKYANKTSGTELSKEQFLHLIKMCHKLYNNSLDVGNSSPFETVMKISYRQFPFQENSLNLLGRHIYLYTKLWPEVNTANDLNVLREIESVIGVHYDAAISFAIALMGNKKGFFFQYTNAELNEIINAVDPNLPINSHSIFLKWCAEHYSFYEQHSDALNPFQLFPIIETKEKPNKSLSEVYLIISYNCLFFKITSSIYYNLIDKFNVGSSNNLFKEKFGYVFEEYIGRLLKHFCSQLSITGEVEYKKKKNNIKTVDWFVEKDDAILMIEVKQSSLFIESKTNTKLDKLSEDLKKTLGKAVIQLDRTIHDIESNKYPELHRFAGKKEIHCLIVTNDPLYNANYIGKDVIKASSKIKNLEYDIINIADFEFILDQQKASQSIFELLAYKKLNHKEFDFKEYLQLIYPDANYNNSFLEEYFNDFFKRFDDKNEG